MLLALSGLCLCGMACDPDWEIHEYNLNIEAQKPAGVDSLEMCVSSSVLDTLICDSTRYSQADFRFDWDSLKVPTDEAVFVVDISFFCDEKKISLPPFTINETRSERVYYYFWEFDERNPPHPYDWHGELLTFLSPEDTSCGKFANYAVFKEIK